MREVTVPWVRRDKLGDHALDRLGAGAQGVVHGVPRPPDRLRGRSLAYKEYTVPFDADVLHDMCCFLELLGDRDRVFLDERLAWPVAMVYEGDPPKTLPPSANPGTRVAGFLMRRVTAEYELHSPQLGEAKPQGLEFLLNDDAYTTRIGLHVDDGQRLRLLLDLARTLDRLHRQRVTVGDLSPKNVMFTLAGQGGCLLIDCDSMCYRGRNVLAQLETPGWEVPEREKATVASDSSKFGRIALRLFNRSQDDMDAGPLREVSTELANLATRSQSAEPHRRPQPADWLPALELAADRWKTRRSTAATRQYAGVTATAPSPTRPSAGTGPRRTAVAAPAGTGPRVTPGRGPAPAGGSSGGGRVARTLVSLLAVAALGYGAVNHLASSDGTDGTDGSSSATAGPYGDPTSGSGSDPGSPETGGSGQTRAEAPGAAVDYAPVADEPEAARVAAMFARFFGAINTRDYDTALSHYDPASEAVDLGSASNRDRWKELMSTTQDSALVLTALDTSGEYTLATMKFRSRQSPGYGPAERPNDTCDDWTVTYQLTDTDGYRIYKAPQEGVSYSPC